MNFFKTIVLVIILAIIIGALIVFVPKFLTQSKSPNNNPEQNVLGNAKASSTPIPTKPPIIIDQNTDLKNEINKIEIPDFKPDFDQLKSELN